MKKKCPESSSHGEIPLIVREVKNIAKEGYKIAIK